MTDGHESEKCPTLDMGMQLLLEVRRIVTDNDRLLREILGMMHQQSKNLEHLPKLNDIAETLAEIKDNLIEPATGRKQIPLASHLLTIAILGAIILLVVMRDTNKSLNIGPAGISIGQQQHNEPGSNN